MPLQKCFGGQKDQIGDRAKPRLAMWPIAMATPGRVTLTFVGLDPIRALYRSSLVVNGKLAAPLNCTGNRNNPADQGPAYAASLDGGLAAS
jgi:hypothetical protein